MSHALPIDLFDRAVGKFPVPREADEQVLARVWISQSLALVVTNFRSNDGRYVETEAELLTPVDDSGYTKRKVATVLMGRFTLGSSDTLTFEQGEDHRRRTPAVALTDGEEFIRSLSHIHYAVSKTLEARSLLEKATQGGGGRLAALRQWKMYSNMVVPTSAINEPGCVIDFGPARSTVPLSRTNLLPRPGKVVQFP